MALPREVPQAFSDNDLCRLPTPYWLDPMPRVSGAVTNAPTALPSPTEKVRASTGYPAGTFWTARAVSADRVRNRIESVLSWCAARGHRPKGPNPAAWSGNLEHTARRRRSPAQWCGCAVHDDRAQRWSPPDSHEARAGG